MIDGLYLITNGDLDGDLLPRVKAALRGGARVIQYREKRLPTQERLGVARKLLELCRRHDALFLVNDLPELAWACGADGVHLGQGDSSIAEAVITSYSIHYTKLYDLVGVVGRDADDLVGSEDLASYNFV